MNISNLNGKFAHSRKAKVRGKSNKYFPVGVVLSLVVVAAFCSLLFVAGFHSVLVSNQYGVDELQRELDFEREQAQVLRMEVARLESPGRILKTAEQRLGMVVPVERKYLEPVRFDDLNGFLLAPVGNPFKGASG